MNKRGSSLWEQQLNIVILSFIPFLFIVLGFLIDTPETIFKGLYDIIIVPDILLTDYLAVGGLGATFVNSGLLSLMCISAIFFLKVPLTGPLIAAVLTVCGFSFIGKNIANVIPILIGGLLYSKHKSIDFKTILTPIFFATTLAPAVSEIAFGLNSNYYFSIPLGIFTGIGIGYVIIPIAIHMTKFHDGYNLYNIGFTGGILGTLITSLIEGFGLTVRTQHNLSTEYSLFIRNLLFFISAFYLIIGYLMNNRSFKGYSKILKPSGRGLNNFIEQFGFGLAYINIGILGFISIFYVIISKGIFNGPIFAGIMTVIAFAPFGKNPKNSIPILVGVYIGVSIKIFQASSTTVIMAALFGTTLAPIAGSYGFIAGAFAGFLHLSVVSNVVQIHNGLNLYNNGFSGGIVAAIMVPILQTFFKKKEGIE